MSKVRTRGEGVRKFILERAEKYPTDISKITATHFGITRQAVNKHLQKLMKEGALVESGHTRNRRYNLASIAEWNKIYKITPKLAEDVVWREDISPILGNMPDNVLNIWHYGFSEMFNNAIDHSGGSEVKVILKKTAVSTEMCIVDNGVGIFKKIQTTFNLLDERHALLELSKGKLTTDPKNHTGQGIFFTSRMFDRYNISSGDIHFSHEFGELEDWILQNNQRINKTLVWMKLDNHTARVAKKIFDQYTSGDDYGFNKTVVPVRLAQYGNDELVSRSQAKRVLAGMESFKVVVFDFEGVVSIGQAFADEIFRVFANKHPEIKLLVINTNTSIEQMIKRANNGIEKLF